MEKFEGGGLAAQFPPQGCGPSPPPEVAVAGGAAHVNVDDIGGGVEGGCPAHDVIHPQCPGPTRTSPPPIDGERRGGLGSGRVCRLRGRGARPGLRVGT